MSGVRDWISNWRQPQPLPDYKEWFGQDYVDPFQAGAAVAFGLMGMAETIRQKLCWFCGAWDPDHECVCFDGEDD